MILRWTIQIGWRHKSRPLLLSLRTENPNIFPGFLSLNEVTIISRKIYTLKRIFGEFTIKRINFGMLLFNLRAAQ